MQVNLKCIVLRTRIECNILDIHYKAICDALNEKTWNENRYLSLYRQYG